MDKYTAAGALGVALIGAVIVVVFPRWGIPMLVVGVLLVAYGVLGPRFDTRNRIRKKVRAINDETRPYAVSYETYYSRIKGNRDVIREIVEDEGNKYRDKNKPKGRFSR